MTAATPSPPRADWSDVNATVYGSSERKDRPACDCHMHEEQVCDACQCIELEAGSDEELRWRGEWLSRLMFGWMIGQRDPGTYEAWLTANGARLV